MRILSLDFDFWVPEDPLLDMGHKETQFHVGLLWNIRLSTYENIRKKLKICPDEKPAPENYASHLRKLGITVARNQIAIAESHASILHFLSGTSDSMDIVSIDAHHDFGYRVDSDITACSSWVKDLVEGGQVRSLCLVYPKWRKNELFDGDWYPALDDVIVDWRKKFGTDVKVVYGLDHVPRNFHADKEFICRSGAWVPPWTDASFLYMVQAILVVQNHARFATYSYDNLEDFKRQVDYEAAEQSLHQQQVHFKMARDAHNVKAHSS